MNTKYLCSNNYSLIIYLCLRKNYAYKNEVKRLYPNNWNYYFKKLLNDNIIKEYKPNDEEESYLVWQKHIGRGNFDNTKFYTLTEESRKFYDQKMFYDFLKSSFTEEIERYILDLQTKQRLHYIRLNERIKKGGYTDELYRSY